MATARIFLSYGRADATELAGRIERELSGRGFDVWRDAHAIRGGHAWEERIRDGLRASQVVVALLSPHSTRRIGNGTGSSGDDSVCLDELAMARFGPQGPKPIVPVLAVPGADVPLSVFRLHRVDMTRCLQSEEALREKLEELSSAVHDALLGRPRHLAWDDWLKPGLCFEGFLHEKRRGFTGRGWLFDQVDAWLGGSDERALLLEAAPGMGKTAVVAEMAYGPFAGRVLCAYCCQWDVDATLKPSAFVHAVASQVASRVSAYAARLDDAGVRDALGRAAEDPAAAFERGVLTPLAALPAPGDGGPRLLVVDALDECVGRGDAAILRLLHSRLDRLPAWLRVVATTRPDRTVRELFGGHRVLRLGAEAEENRDDVANFVRGRVLDPNVAERAAQARLGTNDLVEVLTGRAGGSFLYASQVLRAIEVDQLRVDEVARLPAGLAGLYESFFRRAFEGQGRFEAVRPALALLAVARAPLPRSTLAAAASLSTREFVRTVAPAHQFLAVGGGDDPTYALYHKSLADWLLDDERAGATYAVDPAEGHALLADHGLRERARTGGSGAYHLRHLPHHLAEAGRADSLAALLLDYRWVRAKVDAGLTLALPDEYAAAAAACADHSKGGLLRLLERATRREATFITRHPQLTMQVLWHACYWHDAPEAAEHYRWASDAGGADPRWPWNEPGPRLSDLMRGWLEQSREQGREAAWLRSTRPGRTSLSDQLITTFRGHGGKVTRVAVSADGTRVASGDWNGEVRIWESEAGQELAGFSAGSSYVRSLTAAPNFGRIVSTVCTTEEQVRVWANGAVHDLRDERESRLASIDAAALTPDGVMLILGGCDGWLRVLRCPTGEVLRVLRDEGPAVTGIAVTGDGRRAVAGFGDGSVCAWDLATGTQSRAVATGSDAVEGVAISRRGHCIASVHLDGTLQLFDGELRALATVQAHEGTASCVAMSADGETIVTGGASENEVRVWASSGLRPLAVLTGHEGVVTSVAISDDGRRAVSGSEDCSVRVWRLMAAAALPALEGHESLSCVALTDDGTRVASAGLYENTIRFWETSTGRLLSTIDVPGRGIARIALSRDGDRIVTGDWDGAIQVWDVAASRQLTILSGHAKGVMAVAVAGDGRRIASGSSDHSVAVWDAETGRRLLRLDGHEGLVDSLGFGGDDRLIVSGSWDGTVRVWSAADGRPLAAFPGFDSLHGQDVRASRDGWHAIARRGTRVLVWDLRTLRPVPPSNFAAVEVLADLLAPALIWPGGYVERSRNGASLAVVRAGSDIIPCVIEPGPAGSVADSASAAAPPGR